ncbi:hypothetical protein Ccar_05300 [Clostridium carboxidivorans P7]|uniref:Uncharacterized protein n=1 Tax=Clostridium carboxidivorans P7 TaxID=536227 RepID=C6PSW3_9CLOT|nr:hypothetical protein [Clostridium carboxidivorans]AKN30271.1 hypothetical protein Ccar_05300 [Clostridium carboxidivorans P7]EET87702.1 hypothetical protein CcarbDRAFT_1880 [Clostridium carboxidivorans P7]
MPGSIKKILESVLSKGIYDIIKYLIFIVITGITGLAMHIVVSSVDYLIPYSIIIAIIAAAAMGLLGLFAYKQYSPIYNVYTKTDFKYIFLEKECFYEYIDMHHIIYQKQIKLKVLCKSIDRYYDKYNWTGSDKTKINSADKDHIIILTTKRDSFQQFEVHFGKIYKKGDIINLHLTFELQDNENKANPVISSTIVEPTKLLRLKIKISENYRKGSANAEIFPIIDSRIALDKCEKSFDNNGVINWEISNPPMLLVYSLRWNVPKS